MEGRHPIPAASWLALAACVGAVALIASLDHSRTLWWDAVFGAVDVIAVGVLLRRAFTRSPRRRFRDRDLPNGLEVVEPEPIDTSYRASPVGTEPPVVMVLRPTAASAGPLLAAIAVLTLPAAFLDLAGPARDVAPGTSAMTTVALGFLACFLPLIAVLPRLESRITVWRSERKVVVGAMTDLIPVGAVLRVRRTEGRKNNVDLLELLVGDEEPNMLLTLHPRDVVTSVAHIVADLLGNVRVVEHVGPLPPPPPQPAPPRRPVASREPSWEVVPIPLPARGATSEERGHSSRSK